MHKGALGLALRDVQAAGMQRMARLHHGECRAWSLPRPPALVVSNPPWGQRLLGGERDEGGYDGDDGDMDWWERPEGPAGGGQQRQQPGRGGRRAEAGAEAALAASWWDLSAFLKQQCAGASAFLLSGSPEATKGVRGRWAPAPHACRGPVPTLAPRLPACRAVGRRACDESGLLHPPTAHCRCQCLPASLHPLLRSCG